MIQVKENDGALGIKIAGDPSELMLEMVELIRRFRQVFEEELGQTGADYLIAEIGRIAFMDKDEAHEYMINGEGRKNLERALSAMEGEKE